MFVHIPFVHKDVFRCPGLYFVGFCLFVCLLCVSEVLCESVCGDASCVRAVHLRDNERSTDVDVKSCQGCARARDLPGQGVLCVTAYAAFVHNIHHITPPIVLALDPVSALCVLYLCDWKPFCKLASRPHLCRQSTFLVPIFILPPSTYSLPLLLHHFLLDLGLYTIITFLLLK